MLFLSLQQRQTTRIIQLMHGMSGWFQPSFGGARIWWEPAIHGWCFGPLHDSSDPFLKLTAFVCMCAGMVLEKKLSFLEKKLRPWGKKKYILGKLMSGSPDPLVPLVLWSPAPLVPWSSGPLVPRSLGPLDPLVPGSSWSTGPLPSSSWSFTLLILWSPKYTLTNLK